MSLPSAGKLTRAGKEKNPVTQFSPESQLSGHRGAWHCPASGSGGGKAKKTAFLHGWPPVAQDEVFGTASRKVLMTYECLVEEATHKLSSGLSNV